LKQWEVSGSLKATISEKYEHLVNKMFSNANIDINCSKQEGFLNALMLVCNYVGVSSASSFTSEYESIVEAIAVLTKLIQLKSLTTGESLRE